MADIQRSKLVNCTKCGTKHSRPVGVRCKRQLNISAPASHPASAHSDGDLDVTPPQGAMGSNPQRDDTACSGNSGNVNTSHMNSKLDLILEKMEKIENKNIELETKLTTMTSGRPAFNPTHSSPKKSHRCSKTCESRSSSKASLKRNYSTTIEESSSDEDYDPSHASHRPHRHGSHLSESRNSQDQLSLDFLRNDDRIQKKVQKQLERLQGQQRSTTGKTIKSGLHRAGDNSVKREIAWPHHHCFPGAGGQLPDYKELSPIQFMVGFLGCLQEEASNTVRTNMIAYGRHLFQDALETNWATARHAHMILLQDIERGKCSWRDPDQTEKIRIRNTARIIQPKSTNIPQKQPKNNQREIICMDYTKNTCKFTADHVVDGKIHRHACSYCLQEVGKLCFHKVQDCMRRKGSHKEAKVPSS